jgi:hypothetical protein
MVTFLFHHKPRKLNMETQSQECNICCAESSNIVSMPCCKSYQICVTCGHRLVQNKKLKCPQCRTLVSGDILKAPKAPKAPKATKAPPKSSNRVGAAAAAAAGAGAGAGGEDDLDVALAASALEFKDESERRAVEDDKWLQQLQLALDKSLQEDEAIEVDQELEAVLKLSEQQQLQQLQQLQQEPDFEDILQLSRREEEERMKQVQEEEEGLQRALKQSLDTDGDAGTRNNKRKLELTQDEWEEQEGYKLIRTSRRGKGPARALLLPQNSDRPLEVDVSLKAALELSLQPHWYHKRLREIEELNRNKQGCSSSSASSSSQ